MHCAGIFAKEYTSKEQKHIKEKKTNKKTFNPIKSVQFIKRNDIKHFPHQ